DNTFPIILRLSHLRKSTSISLGHFVPEKDWDPSKRIVKKSFKGVSSISKLNNKLQKEKTRAVDIINDISDKGGLNYLSINQVKERIVNKNSYDSFFDFGYRLVDELKKSKRYGNARSYNGVLGILKRYNKNKDLKFNELNYDYLKKFERHHLSKGNTYNGFSSYMRTIRAIYNKGIKEGLIERQAYPFALYKIKTTTTEKRAIDIEHIKRILELKLYTDHSLFNYRNYFLASYMLYGISFIDLAFLKIENIIDGRINFQRKKTSKIYNIKITDQLKEILSFYINDKTKDDYIFPIIRRDTLELKYRDVEWARKRYNKGLKDIAGLCDIEHRLTSYVSRHSFATQAMLQDVPLMAISAMLGHSKLNTTQIYLKSLPNNILDEYNERINQF
ncbi:MAG: site-specific integrase, partial [Bacteroidota bacterium]